MNDHMLGLEAKQAFCGIRVTAPHVRLQPYKARIHELHTVWQKQPLICPERSKYQAGAQKEWLSFSS